MKATITILDSLNFWQDGCAIIWCISSAPNNTNPVTKIRPGVSPSPQTMSRYYLGVTWGECSAGSHPWKRHGPHESPWMTLVQRRRACPKIHLEICNDVWISRKIGTTRRKTTTTWNGMKYTMMPGLNHHQMWRGTDANSSTLRMDSTSSGRNASTLVDGLPQTKSVLRVGMIR